VSVTVTAPVPVPVFVSVTVSVSVILPVTVTVTVTVALPVASSLRLPLPLLHRPGPGRMVVRTGGGAMRAIVVGGGLVGSTLAGKLAADGHDIVVVEQDRELLADIADRLDVQTLVGNGATVPVLVDAGIEGCDLLFATTNSDEANMVVALVGSALFKVPRVVARLRDAGHQESFKALAAEGGGQRLAINPEEAAVERILSLLPVPGAVDAVPFLEGRILVAGFNIEPSSDFAGLLLSHLRLLFPAVPMLVVAIRRNGRWIVPHGEDEITAGDLVYFALDPGQVDNVLALLGRGRPRGRKVMIAGATRIGIRLAEILEGRGVPVTLVEEHRAACDQAAARLDRTLVIHGMPTDRELLEEEGIADVYGFVGCTEDHEVNVVSALLTRQLGAGQTFAVVDNPALVGLVGELGIDAIISPRMLSVSLALQFVRRGRVRAVAALLDDLVEVMEVEASSGSRLASGRLAEIGLPRGVLVAAIQRGDRIFVPGGGDRVEPGDRALLITTADAAGRLDGFLGG